MEIGTEISQKIRSAIKAKLIELGAYVDDELPDYIMVMVANKKTQQQMTDDLSLFLATNTEKFTAWLHSLLKKLQSINSEAQPASKEKHKHKPGKHDKQEKHEKSEKQDKPEKQDKSDKTKSVKRKKSHSDKSKSGEPGKQKKTSGDAAVSDSGGLSKQRRSSLESGETNSASSQKRKLSTETIESSDVTKEKKTKVAESTKGDKVEVKKAEVVPAKKEKKDKNEEKPEINIIENTDEFSEELKVEETKEVKKASKAAPVKVAKSDRDKDVSKQKITKTKETVKSGEKTKVSSKSKPSSVVGSVKRKFVDEEEGEEEEYDPLNPAVGTVASVIRGPARKSSVPKSLQANRSLLMRAVSDAEKSVADVKIDSSATDGKSTSKPVQKVTPDLRGRLKTAAGLQLISKSRRQETLESMKYTVDNKEKSDKTKVSKSQEKKVEPIKDLKMTVKNEPISQKKAAAPKSKAPAIAPARVAQEALRSISKNKPVVTKVIKQEELDELEEEGSTSDVEELTDNGDSEENSDVSSDVDSDDDGGDDESDESVEEIEIEITDRAMQTELTKLRMDKIMSQGNSKVDVRNRSAQTENDTSDGSVKVKLTSDKVKEIDSNLLNMMIDSFMPLKFIEHESFRIFCKSLETKYHLPKVKKLAGQVTKRYETMRCQLEQEMKGIDSTVLTHNSWSTVDGQCYINVLAHYITDDWKLTSVTLTTCAIDQEETDNITPVLKRVLIDWKLPPCVTVKGAGKHELLALVSSGFKRIICLGHCLKWLVKDCLNYKQVASLIEKGRNFLRALQNVCLRDDLKKDQKADLSAMLEFHKLSLDNPTLWNTTVDMLSSLSDQAETIRDVVKELKLSSIDTDIYLYSDEDIIIIKSVVLVLSQFKTATEILTASEITTAEKVLPTLIKLQKAVTEVANESAVVVSFKSELRKQINSVILHNKESLLLSCIVHPQTKQMLFVAPEEMSHAKLLLFDEMTNILRKGVTTKHGSKRTEEEMSDGGSKSVSHSSGNFNLDSSISSKANEQESSEKTGLVGEERNTVKTTGNLVMNQDKKDINNINSADADTASQTGTSSEIKQSDNTYVTPANALVETENSVPAVASHDGKDMDNDEHSKERDSKAESTSLAMGTGKLLEIECGNNRNSDIEMEPKALTEDHEDEMDSLVHVKCSQVKNLDNVNLDDEPEIVSEAEKPSAVENAAVWKTKDKSEQQVKLEKITDDNTTHMDLSVRNIESEGEVASDEKSAESNSVDDYEIRASGEIKADSGLDVLPADDVIRKRTEGESNEQQKVPLGFSNILKVESDEKEHTNKTSPERKKSGSQSSDAESKSKSDNTDWLEDVIGTGELQDRSPEEKAKIELDLYLAEPPVKTNALTWWKEKQIIFPTVSKVAKRLLAIPASSISLDSVFSFQEDIVDARKSQIDPKHIDTLLFLNKNKGTLQES